MPDAWIVFYFTSYCCHGPPIFVKKAVGPFKKATTQSNIKATLRQFEHNLLDIPHYKGQIGATKRDTTRDGLQCLEQWTGLWTAGWHMPWLKVVGRGGVWLDLTLWCHLFGSLKEDLAKDQAVETCIDSCNDFVCQPNFTGIL